VLLLPLLLQELRLLQQLMLRRLLLLSMGDNCHSRIVLRVKVHRRHESFCPWAMWWLSALLG